QVDEVPGVEMHAEKRVPQASLHELEELAAGHPDADGLVPLRGAGKIGRNEPRPRDELPGHPVLRGAGDPLVACGDYHGGRSAVLASDCAPHWGPPGFLDWPGYLAPWANLISWLAGSW